MPPAQAPRHIGIAAVTAEGAALTYRHICALASQRLGRHRHPEITLHSFSFSEHVQAGGSPQAQQARWASLLRQSAAKLHRAGAQLLICPANTPHAVYERVAPLLPMPWLHIADGVRQAALRLGSTRPLLLGTRFTLASGLFEQRCQGSGITFMRPGAAQAQTLHQIIVDELVPGTPSAAARQYLARLIEQHRQRGADSVVLGCTELPLVIDTTSTPLPLIDTTLTLATQALEHALDMA